MKYAMHRRHAVQIVAALPEDTEDALIVLDLARQFVERFLAAAQCPVPELDRDGERFRRAVVSLSSTNKGASF
jgi:hypothetical protein